MNEPISIGSTWKALEIKGLGVIVQGDKGLLFVPATKIQDGEIVTDLAPDTAAVGTATVVQPARRGPASQSEVTVKGFLEAMKQKNLTAGGEYGAYGPLLNRLKELLFGLEEDSPLLAPLGTFLALGDHPRYGFAAAVVALSDAKLNELTALLAQPEAEPVEAFVEKCLTGAA